ncbi:MAG TPA: S41 family peptidase, partial [Bacteroidota bacterium]|nr:S41 family peptidase [Bacteroidota bacterium]
ALLIVLCMSAAIVGGCKKSNPIDNPPSVRTLLTDKTWQSKSVYELHSGTPVEITDASGIGYYRMNNDGTFSSSMLDGTWELSSDDFRITFVSGQITLTAEILEITASTLHLKISIPQNIPPSILDISFIPAPTSNTLAPEANFEDLWKQFDTRYSFFEVKNINWDSLYAVYRPRVTSTTTNAELFAIMSNLLLPLKDGHVNLFTPYGTFAYTGWYDRYPMNFLGTNTVAKYLSKDYGTTAGGMVRYGVIGTDLGYIYMGPNLTGDAGVWNASIDMILDSLKEMRGIVVDIRNNTGGNDGLGRIVAGRFTDRYRTYAYTRWRNGARHSDFTDYAASTIGPLGKQQFLKPVALLTNRRCFSSAEGTILMFRALPNVTTIGDTTGGGSANPLTLSLPNGWKYRVSRWIQYTDEKKVFEGTGLPPDIPLWIPDSDAAAGRDAILDRAIGFLRSGANTGKMSLLGH